VELSPEAVQRLVRLGYQTDADLRYWRWVRKTLGESGFWGFLGKSEQAAEEYRRWFPRLQGFAAECRGVVPAPVMESLSPAEREEYRILLTKMREFASSGDCRTVLNRKPNQAAILSTTRVGLIAAKEVFGNSGAVILEQSERDRWLSEVCPVDAEAFWWYAFAWWGLREGLVGEDGQWVRQRYPIPAGCSYWVVVSGVQWGTLAGGSNHELWRWDGERADFIEVYCVTHY
jgi:hypothetical protein